MAWSEWLPGEVLQVTPHRLVLNWLPDTTTTTYSTDNGELSIQGSHSAPSVWPEYDETGASGRPSPGSAQPQPNLNGYTYWLPDGWESRRDGKPAALDALTEGVDYAVIPGKDPWADDAYVEYETGVSNTLDGWDLGTFTVTGHDFVQDVASGAQTTGKARALLGGGAMGRTPYASLGEPVVDLSWREWDLGQETDGLQFQPPDPGPVEQLFYFVDVSTSGPPNTYASVSFVLKPIEARVSQPRWRYWIPGDLPLRQRQRDDGLGLSTARWRRGRSRQVSNRWKGYL